MVASRVASLAFLKPNFEIQAFFDALVFFFENKKSQLKSQNLAYSFLFCSVWETWLWQNMSQLHTFVHYKYLLTGVYDHAGCKEYCKDFSVALQIFDVFNKKQMYDRIITGKENASKNWNCILPMFLTSVNIFFCLVMHVLCVAYMSKDCYMAYFSFF